MSKRKVDTLNTTIQFTPFLALTVDFHRKTMSFVSVTESIMTDELTFVHTSTLFANEHDQRQADKQSKYKEVTTWH